MAKSCRGVVGSAQRKILAIVACSRDLCSSSLSEVVAMWRLLEELGPGGIAMKVRMAVVLVVAAKCESCSEEIVMLSKLWASLALSSAWAIGVVLMESQ